MHDQTSFRISKTMLRLFLSLICIHQVCSLQCDSINDQDVQCKQCLSINNTAHGCKESELFYIPFDYCFARSDSKECKCVCQEDNCNSNNDLKCKAKESDQLSFRIQYYEQNLYFTPSLKTDTDQFFEYMEANFNGMFEIDGQFQNVSYINTTQKVKPLKDGERLTCIDNTRLYKGEEVKYEVECEMDQNVCKVASSTNTK